MGTLCSVKEARHERPFIVFCSYEMFTTGESIERDDWLVAGAQGEVGMIVNGNQHSLGDDRSVLELGNDDSCTTLQMC